MTANEGRVTGLQRSAGGVPKLPVKRAMVRSTGMEGDKQANRKFHGGPQRALCLYSQEHLDELASRGHPVQRGTLGENVTIAGLHWGRVRPGARLRMGAVEVEVTGFAAPCATIKPGFSDGVFSRVGEKLNPGWSRVYVRIVVEGEIAVGDPVTLAPVRAAEHTNIN
jgi:MOSC domain-containing protein YiiM